MWPSPCHVAHDSLRAALDANSGLSANIVFLQVPDVIFFVDCPLVLDCHVPITMPHIPKHLATLLEGTNCTAVSGEYTW
jgi:hypothetical protein